MNTPSNIVGCYGALVGLLGVQGAREVCVKNPAVLGNNPSSLAGCSAQEVRDASPTPNPTPRPNPNSNPNPNPNPNPSPNPLTRTRTLGLTLNPNQVRDAAELREFLDTKLPFGLR